MLFPIDLLKAEVLWEERRRQVEQVERAGGRWPITASDGRAPASIRTSLWRLLACMLGRSGRSRPAAERCEERPRRVAA